MKSCLKFVFAAWTSLRVYCFGNEFAGPSFFRSSHDASRRVQNDGVEIAEVLTRNLQFEANFADNSRHARRFSRTEGLPVRAKSLYLLMFFPKFT